MRFLRFLLLLVALLAGLAARGADNIDDAARTVSERVTQPSPDVAQMRQYADCPVSYQGLYSGSIAKITDTLDGLVSDNSYGYDAAGRLSFADIDVGGNDRSTGYNYDLNGNICFLTRLGDNGASKTALIDELYYEYDGNRVRSIYDGSGATINEHAMNFADGVDLDTEYSYDANGNMLTDSNKGISYEWDYNNMLRSATRTPLFDYSTYTRTATGTRLSRTYTKRQGTLISPTIDLGTRPWWPTNKTETHTYDTYGPYEFEDGKFARFNNTIGYIDSVEHVYIHDWQGNVRAVVHQGSGGATVLDQTTYYYPYGMPMAESTSPDANRYKYTAKELFTDSRLNLADHGARMYDPAIGRWISQDPLTETTRQHSPYVFCGGDPINHVDKDGNIFETIWDIGNVVYDAVSAVYDHIQGDHEAAKEHWIDAAYDTGAALVPFVPAGASKGAKLIGKAVKGTDKSTDVGKGMRNAKEIAEGRAFEKEQLQLARERGEEVADQVKLVPQNGKGNVKDNTTFGDQLKKNEDETYTLREAKRSSSTPLSPGQKAAKEHIVNGNKKFEVRSDKLEYGLKKGDVITIIEHERLNKYNK